ncbi:MAG TPA: response regulator, partial [Candidatus Omnitrophota bacterium]|nr:response regulator [Candidatus Omnitrophota bacterium]
MSDKLSVLAVDDDPMVLKLVEAHLAPKGYHVATALSGTEGLEKAAKEKAGFVILDVSMPSLSGFEVCRKLRERQEYRNVPILMMTGKNKESDIVEALESGADDYLIKPVEADLLTAKVEQLLKLAKENSLPSRTYSKA